MAQIDQIEVTQGDRDAVDAFHSAALHSVLSGKRQETHDILAQAFARHREQEVNKIVAWLREAEWPYRNDALIAAIEAGEYLNG